MYMLQMAEADFQCFILFSTVSCVAIVGSLATICTETPHLAGWAWQQQSSN